MARLILSLLVLLSSTAMAGIELLPGSSPQSTALSTSFANPVRVRVFDDATGAGIAGATVTWSHPAPAILGMGGQCNPDLGGQCVATTGSDGVLEFRPYGQHVGHHHVRFSSGARFVDADLTVFSTVNAPEIAIVSGDGQRLPVGAGGAPFVVRVTRDGLPVAGAGISFLTQLGPRIDFTPPIQAFPSTFTDSNGIASSPPMVVSSGLGPVKVVASLIDSASDASVSVTFTLTAVDASGSSFVSYRPLWWGGPAQSGWGISIPQRGESLFPIYFTYDGNGRPTWYVLEGRWLASVGGRYVANFTQYQGSPYFAFDSRTVKSQRGGNGWIDFGGAPSSATLSVQFEKPPLMGFTPPARMVAIEPFVFSPATPQPERGVSDIWWGGPAQSGWGMTIAEDHGNLFLVWFTYDPDGQPVWLSMSEGAWLDADTWAGPVFRTRAATRPDGSVDSGAVQETKVGDFRVRFSGTAAATFDYSVEGHAGSLQLQRFDF